MNCEICVCVVWVGRVALALMPLMPMVQNLIKEVPRIQFAHVNCIELSLLYISPCAHINKKIVLSQA